MICWKPKTAHVLLFLSVFYAACAGTPPELTVKPGATQTSEYLPLLNGKSVALVANHTSIIGNTHLADSLIRSGIFVKKIFSPEHGLIGHAGAGDLIQDGTYGTTGIPVISLYGEKKKPAPGDLNNIDIVVFDMQDVGVRFYTYISTLHYVMEACAENNKPLLLLDRPNPLGHFVDGPLLEPAFQSFVGMHPIPVVYGMTIGELAAMINGEGWLAGGIKCKLKVIPCLNYNHDSLYRLPVNPSPNLNSMEAIYLYPSLCFFEGTIMSLGRGTDFPFRVFGHPDYPDTAFFFVPKPNIANKAPLFVNQTCFGTDLRKLTAGQLAQMKEINLEWLVDAYQAMGSNKSFFTTYFNNLAGTAQMKKQILAGKTAAEIRQTWQADLERFRVLRKKYLLYNDFR
ncbi:MAG: DUF1343 domain-containing protein [Bacteroidales bacterium]|nr:DUF1343 domain-containing protein [Bacteroidales bacterium]